jgi:hypothetical protein
MLSGAGRTDDAGAQRLTTGWEAFLYPEPMTGVRCQSAIPGNQARRVKRKGFASHRATARHQV